MANPVHLLSSHPEVLQKFPADMDTLAESLEHILIN